MLVAVGKDCVLPSGRWFKSRVANISFFFLFFYAHLLRPSILKRVVLTRDSTRPDLLQYTMKFNDFYVVLIGIESHEDSTSLFCKSTSQILIIFYCSFEIVDEHLSTMEA